MSIKQENTKQETSLRKHGIVYWREKVWNKGIPQRILFCPNVPKTAFIINYKVFSKKIGNGRGIGDNIRTKKKKIKIWRARIALAQ